MKTLINHVLVLLLTVTSGASLSPPEFTVLPKDETIVLKLAQVSLRCDANGIPTPAVVNWLHNDKPINFASSLYTLKSTGELYIREVREEDSGDYQCVAQNALGGVVSEKKRLEVAYFDQVARPPIERIAKAVYEYFTAKPPGVKCNPKPKFVWKKNDVVLQESDRIMINEEGVIFITTLEVADQGKYTLTIENPSLISADVQFASQLVKEVELSVEQKGLQPPNTVDIVYASERRSAGELKTDVAKLECFTTGLLFDRISISWQKNWSQ